MQNALLLSALKLTHSLSLLSAKKKPFGKKQLKQFNESVIQWYERFTDIPKKDLTKARKEFAKSFKPKKLKSKKQALHSAVINAVDFLHAYLEPAEIVNMAHFGAEQQKHKALKKMSSKLGKFHKKQMGSLKWLITWLDEVDPLFPAESIRNKVACCFADVAAKPCFEVEQVCYFEPQIDWIGSQVDRIPGMQAQDDCCQGSTLSSCSGGTLYCDCVAGNTGCDCKAPNRLCSENNRNISELIPGFGDPNCMMLYEEFTGAGSIDPAGCHPFDPVPDLDVIHSTRTSIALDLDKGRFCMPKNMRFDLGRVIMSYKECQQTGFCPPQSNGCPDLA